MPSAHELTARAGMINLGSLFSTRARFAAEQVALESPGARLSYAQLDERANRLANALAGLGVARGDRICVLSENRFEYVETVLAAAKLGCIVAAQNWRLVQAELAYCTQLVEPKLVLVSPRFQALLAGVPHQAARVLAFGDEYEALLAAADRAEPPDVAQPEDGLIILYTSGTTGLPKGALISHRAMMARAQIFYLDLQLEPASSFIAWSPMYHMVSADQMLATLINGGKVIVLDGYDADALADIVAREKIGWLSILPGTVEAFNAAMQRKGVRPAGVKVVGGMADLVPRHQLAELTGLLNAPFMNSFGSTETGIPPASKNFVAVGQAPQDLPKTQNSLCQIRLVDEDDHEVPDGEPGELAIRGPTVFSGYWNAPEANARDFRGGWFHMGDVFVRNADGTLSYVDRRKYLIKSGGENIYPAEIERLLLADARVAEAVVVRKPDARWGEVPVAFVVRKDQGLTEADVMACCDGRIARYKLPKEVRFVADADLPRSATGKIKRFELEEQFEPKA